MTQIDMALKLQSDLVVFGREIRAQRHNTLNQGMHAEAEAAINRAVAAMGVARHCLKDAEIPPLTDPYAVL